jgi:hypothetical protein
MIVTFLKATIVPKIYRSTTKGEQRVSSCSVSISMHYGGKEVTMKYRKKPVIIEAEVYREGLEDGFDECDNCFEDEDFCQHCEPSKPYIDTLEGKHYITPGDYIITGDL